MDEIRQTPIEPAQPVETYESLASIIELRCSRRDFRPTMWTGDVSSRANMDWLRLSCDRAMWRWSRDG